MFRFSRIFRRQAEPAAGLMAVRAEAREMPGPNPQGDAFVWYLKIKPETTFGFRGDLWEQDIGMYRKRYVQFARGELAYEAFPDRLWIREDFQNDSKRELPHIFNADDYRVVSKGMAELLRRFGLGRSMLRPVDLLKHDRETPFLGQWNLFQICEFKEGFEPDHSCNFKPMRRPDFPYLGTVEVFAKDGDIRVNPSVRGGPDLWTDPRLNGSTFVTDRLMRALRDADMLGNVRCLKCPIVAADD